MAYFLFYAVLLLYMQIPKDLPQFESYPTLFVVSGEYEAGLYLAQNGIIEKMKGLKMAPREEAREKQAFVGRKGGMSSLSSVSHHGAYVGNLKKKFQKNVHAAIHDFLAEYPIQEIYLFAPRYAAARIIDGLDKAEQKKVRMKFYKEYTKESPISLIKKFQVEINKVKILSE